ncbi:glutamine amidotransferase [Oceanospirillum multiglobuliferum]|uniref:Imidazole glycerol phosphate synthase subunit HisH n=1 Tax=Oceanospirillum multiglobuliferum TaxID=64969 RepID=A0A1T4L3W8_9GAMM|nr:imidazole glycerol phosphate synthase subunit HisH [Oceanospirillum multiglobuliferum]OPX56818.1 imidazole glycerol phosphate synthase subunit HisH [Oceanospirillum multiglobuliferum]SJZ49210.1 glutamine amidotransferase [Oceanospirillum multiglobuliferum]
MLAIVDLGIGNIGSVAKALDYLKVKYQIIVNPNDLSKASKIVLPGVGSFAEAVTRLDLSGFRSALLESVYMRNTPILGICVGMQLLSLFGTEGGDSKGLGFINAYVDKIDDFNGRLVIPHMGWNELSSIDHPLFRNVHKDACFYFVHSYAMQISDKAESNLEVIYTDYEQPVVAFVAKNHIYGAQFHPEKSQQPGLTFLRNFVELC